ncbi:hypothetical protein EON63_11525 [archaeon]|nr:MAG: hypothetical protein EON63_11525 [archaeon]
MADITYWFDELQKEVDQYQAMVERLKTIVESSNLKAIELLMKDCEAKAVRIREVKKSFGLEVRLIRDRNVRSNYEAQAAVYDERFNFSVKDFSACQTSINKKSLLKESSTTHGFRAEGKDNDALLGEAHRLQDLTMESLGRTKNMIEASKEIGTATIEQLRGQKEQIVEIENEVSHNMTRMDSVCMDT